MRRTFWIISFGAAMLLTQAAMAQEPCAQTATAEAPAAGCLFCQAKCHPAPAYNLAPGCCEPRRHCFDNAWDGYCEHRARWDTFWCKVGTGALCPCTSCCSRDGRGVALEVQVRPSAAACAACQNQYQAPTTAVDNGVSANSAMQSRSAASPTSSAGAVAVPDRSRQGL